MNKKITQILSLSILLLVAIGFAFVNKQNSNDNKNISSDIEEISGELAYVSTADTASATLASENSEHSDISAINKRLLSLEDEIEVLEENASTSFYNDKFVGRKTASGEIYNNREYTAAHKSLPFGSKLRITNNKNDESVIVTVNDRGPYTKGRHLDLSKQAYLDITHNKNAGVLNVKIEVLPEDYEFQKTELLEDLDEFIL